MARILIAEDDPSVTFLYQRLLEAQNHVVRCESTADAFLAAVSEFKPELIVLDVILPGGVSGIDLCQKLRKSPEVSKLPILMASCAVEDEDVRKGIASGADEYLAKPVRNSELVTKINLLLAKGSRTRQFPLIAKGTFRGRYRLEELLGRNPDCSSYLAIDVKSPDSRRVALKIFNRISQSESDRSSFLLEADTISRLDHPGIAKVLDYGLTGDKIFVATEIIEGDSLGDMLRTSQVSENIALIVAKEVVRALAYIDSNSMLHKNVKPNNIMVSSSGEIKLVDFAIKGETCQDTLRINERMFGQIQFMAPERLGGVDGVVGIKSDIFSLGLTLYYAVSGTLPLYSPDPVVMLQKYLTENPPPLKAEIAGVSDDFSDLIDIMIAKRTQDRYGIAQVTEALDRLAPLA